MKDIDTGTRGRFCNFIELSGYRSGLLGHLLFDHEPLDDHFWMYES
ncbi:uncharacterized protein METZ01_LOCUS426172, partial [marine metagenome]